VLLRLVPLLCSFVLLSGCSALTSTDEAELAAATDTSGDGGGRDGGQGDSASGTSSRQDSGVATDATVTTTADSAIDAGPDNRGVSCGAATCSASTPFCCYAGALAPYCIAMGPRCICPDGDCGAFSVSCDGPEDCGGNQVCCARKLINAAQPSEIRCRPQCESDSRTIAFELCHTDQPSTCSDGSECRASPSFLPSDYGVCDI